MKALVATLCAVLGLATGTVRGATISLSPTLQSTAPGSPVTLDLNISGLSSTTALSAFDISVNFDATRLNFSNATFGDPVLGDQLDLGHLGLNGPIAIRGTGTVDLIEADIFDSPSALLGSQAKSFTLAALTFYGLGAGSTPVTLTTNSLADQNGALFVATTVNASVTIAPVPLPPAMWLLASSLLGLAVIRFRSVSSQSLLK